MSLADYLAKNYLSTDAPKDKKKKSKKEKKSKKNDIPQVAIKTEDEMGWDQPAAGVEEEVPEEDDLEDIKQDPTTPARKGGWKKLGDESGQFKLKTEIDAGPRMSSGARAGLQTADQIQKDIEEKRRHELEEAEQMKSSVPEETVYRDATGRRLDIMEEQKRIRAAEQEEADKKEKFRKDVRTGWAQKDQAQRERENLHSVKSARLNRYADDKELNDIQRSEARFNDPGALFLKNSGSSKSRKESSSRLPIYSGSFEQNRFNLAPGVKWDGVDRSNGFEKKWFLKQNEIKHNKHISYSMSQDV